MVAEYEEVFRNDIREMEKLDFIFSKGKLSLEMDGCEPSISEDRIINLVEARHPLMDRKVCVPLDFTIGNGTRGIVITGPNTGGKTVALKTVVLNCMMAQCGLHVPCKEANICMNSNYLCDIGDGQNISENLSTFSAHITNVLDILKNVNKESLVVMDELGSGTDPLEGMGIAVSILEELKESCAFYIASRIGMPFRMIERAAKEAYGEEYDITKVAINKDECKIEETLNNKYNSSSRIAKKKKIKPKKKIEFHRGDSVMVYPDKKIGIVCKEANEKGVLQVQMPGKKIWINHKRLKLHVAATELYPEDYDFSIIFDSVEVRKARHQMDRKYVEGCTIEEE